MKTRYITVNIMRLLNYQPDHGYNLYLQLKDEFEINNPSELYKILKNMESKGFIEVTKVEKEAGRDRKILKMTERGKEEYLKLSIESSMILIDLIADTVLFKVNGLLKEFFDEKYPSLFNKMNSILLDLELPVKYQLKFINDISDKFIDRQRIYFQDSYGKQSNLRIESPNVELHLLNNQMKLVPNSLDIVVGLGRVIKSKLTAQDGWLDLLKPDGKIIYINYKSPFRFGIDGLSSMLKSFIQSLIEKEFEINRLPNILGVYVDKSSENNFDASPREVRQLLKENFGEVTKLKGKNYSRNEFIEIIVAENPIKK